LSNRSGNSDVWVVDTAGGSPRQLTDWPSDELGEPEWAADGSGVYFASPRDATPYADLWFVPAAGGEPRRVTTSGTFLEVTTSPYTPDVFIRTFGGPEGRVVLNRLLPNGNLQVLWDQTNVMELWRHGVMPSGDSIVVDAERPDGTLGSVLVPVHGGEGRWILGEREVAGGWSSDGTRLAYGAGMGNRDIGVFSLQDGSKRRLMETASWESLGRWAAGDQSIVFARRTTRRLIVTADVGTLIEGGN
jgi:Tol biopolymer transport system component